MGGQSIVARIGRRSASAMAGLGLLLAASAAAEAEPYRFELDYALTLNGLPLGRAALSGTVNGANYRLDGQGKLTGLAGAVLDYAGSASSAGRLVGEVVDPSAFSVDATDGRKATTVRMTLVDKGVRRLRLNPPASSHPARVEVRDAHKRGVLDPMSAIIAPTGYAGGRFDRSVCDTRVPVFNGRERFDVLLSYKGMEEMKGSSGYSGPVMVCEARYRPISGHRSDKEEVQYFADRVVVEVWLAPLGGSEMLVPVQVIIPTPIGSGMLRVTELSTKGTLPVRAAALDK